MSGNNHNQDKPRFGYPMNRDLQPCLKRGQPYANRLRRFMVNEDGKRMQLHATKGWKTP